MVNLDLDIKKEECTQVRILEEKKNKWNPGEGIPATYESLVATNMYKQAKQAVETAKLAATIDIAKAFELYGNLLSNEAR